MIGHDSIEAAWLSSGHDPIEWASKTLAHSVYIQFIVDPRSCVLCNARTIWMERYTGRPVCGKCSEAITQGEFAELVKGGGV